MGSSCWGKRFCRKHSEALGWRGVSAKKAGDLIGEEPSHYCSNEECLGGIFRLLGAEMSEKRMPEGS